MSTVERPVEEVTQEAIRILAREMGLADTMRFLRQFVSGTGNYVEERHALLGNPSVEEFFAEVERREALRAAKLER
jgi:hypothetical protein